MYLLKRGKKLYFFQDVFCERRLYIYRYMANMCVGVCLLWAYVRFFISHTL